jgi:hypothetical protein
VISRPVEALVRRADRDGFDPYLMPGDAIACYDSAITNFGDVVDLLADGAMGATIAGDGDPMSTQPGLTVWHWIRYGADPRGRFKRYAAATTLLLLVVWTLVAAYCALAPASYTSRFTLLLPAAGVSTSLQLDSLGQAVSSTTSPYSSSSLSPTEKYKRLVMAEGTLAIAADELKMSLADFPQPRITLVDQTELIIVSVNAGSAEVARDRAVAPAPGLSGGAGPAAP